MQDQGERKAKHGQDLGVGAGHSDNDSSSDLDAGSWYHRARADEAEGQGQLPPVNPTEMERKLEAFLSAIPDITSRQHIRALVNARLQNHNTEQFFEAFAESILKQKREAASHAEVHLRMDNDNNDHGHHHHHHHGTNANEHHHTAIDAYSRNTMIMETLFGILNSITLAQTFQAMSGLDPAWMDMDLWSLILGSVIGILLAFSAAGTHYYLNKRYQPKSTEAQRYLESGRKVPKVPWPLPLKILYYYYKFGDAASHTLNYASAAIQITEDILAFKYKTLEEWQRIIKGVGYLAIMAVTAAFATPGEVRPCWVELEEGFDFWAFDLQKVKPEDAFDTNTTLQTLLNAVRELKKMLVLENFSTALKELIRMHADHSYEKLVESDKARFYEPIYNALVRDQFSMELLRNVPLAVLEEMRAYFKKSSEFNDDEFIIELNLLISSSDRILREFEEAKARLMRGFPKNPLPDDFSAIYEALGKHNYDPDLLQDVPYQHLKWMQEYYLSLMPQLGDDLCYIIFMRKLEQLCPIRENDRFGPARIEGTAILQRLGLFKVQRELSQVASTLNNNNQTAEDDGHGHHHSHDHDDYAPSASDNREVDYVGEERAAVSASEPTRGEMETDDEEGERRGLLSGRPRAPGSSWGRCNIL